MKNILTIFAVFIGMAAVAQYGGIEIEEVDNGPNVPGKTYRIYVKLVTDSSQVTGIYGLDNDPLYIKSSSTFYQHEYGGESSFNLNRKMLRDIETLKYDSYVTIGDMDNYDNQMNSSMIDLGDFESGKNIETTDGIWYALPYNPQCYPDKDGRVLIMQLTSTGKVEVKFNIAGRYLLEGHNDLGNRNFEPFNIMGETVTVGE